MNGEPASRDAINSSVTATATATFIIMNYYEFKPWFHVKIKLF